MRVPDQKTLLIIRRILFFLFALNFSYMFVQHGYFKFDPEGFWSSSFEKWGYPFWFMVFIGVLEFGGGIAILIPRIASYGGLVLAVVMLGALITRLIHGTSHVDVIALVSYIVSMLIITFEYSPVKDWQNPKPEIASD